MLAMRSRKGFTLMELMIVIAIMMILAGAIVARVSTGGEKAKVAKATAEMNEIASACRSFYSDTGAWPYGNSWGAGGDGGLIEKGNIKVKDDNGTNLTGAAKTVVENNWKGPYLEAFEWPLDPWKSVYYDLAGNSATLAVLCCGPDGGWDGGAWDSGETADDDLMVLIHRFQ